MWVIFCYHSSCRAFVVNVNEWEAKTVLWSTLSVPYCFIHGHGLKITSSKMPNKYINLYHTLPYNTVNNIVWVLRWSFLCGCELNWWKRCTVEQLCRLKGTPFLESRGQNYVCCGFKSCAKETMSGQQAPAASRFWARSLLAFSSSVLGICKGWPCLIRSYRITHRFLG